MRTVVRPRDFVGPTVVAMLVVVIALVAASVLSSCASGPQLPITTAYTEIHMHCEGSGNCSVDRNSVEPKPITTGVSADGNTVSPNTQVDTH